MLVRAPARRPMVLALASGNGQIVDARDATLHESAIVELPVLVAVGAIPIARIVMPLVREPNGNAVALAGPEFLDEPILKLPRPFAPQKFLNRCSTRQEL